MVELKKQNLTWKRHKLTRKWEGIVKLAYDMIKDEKDMAEFMTEKTCDSCNGNRLKPSSQSVFVAGKTIGEVINKPIEDAHKPFFKMRKTLNTFNEKYQMIAAPILKED